VDSLSVFHDPDQQSIDSLMSCRTIIFWAIPALLLMLQVPVFLQMPLTPDAVLYDLQARCLMQGGILYRDIVEPNLPGVVWIHAVVRSLFGSSDQVLRFFDLVIVLGITGILCRIVAAGTDSRWLQHASMAVLASLLLLFYLGISEWCHCQRDTWMLLPCLLAVATRTYCSDQFRHTDAKTSFLFRVNSERALLLLAVLEGSLWAIAFWIKPFVALPAFAVMLASRSQFGSRNGWLKHSGYVIAGGAAVGLLGILWMVNAGCWKHFVEMMTSWNGDYYQAGRSRWNLERFQAHASRFWPWVLIHIPALVISVRNRRSLVCACYLGWLLQAVLLQQLFDYVHVPGVILAIAICARTVTEQLHAAHTAAASQLSSDAVARFPFSAVSCMASVIVIMSVMSSGLSIQSRLTYLRPCVSACVYGSLSPDVRDSISQSPFPCWAELKPLTDHLRELNVSDRQLLAYNGNLIHLYPQMKFDPPTRFVYLDVLARCFPRRHTEMLQEVERRNVRYVVANLREDGWDDEVPSNKLLPVVLEASKAKLFFPYNQRPVFRSGSYVLFEVDAPPGSLTSQYFPLSEFRTKIIATGETGRIE
jgi:hypothetical protein